MNDDRLGDYLKPEEHQETNDAKNQDVNYNEPGLEGSMFQQEADSLKIEKLSQRITIISVIIPCIIIAILVFVYLDISEKVVDVDQTQANLMAQVSQEMETKLNSLDVRIAKATHDLDEKLTTLETKRQALENQTAKMSAAKVDLKAMESALAKLNKRIKANANQDKSTLAAMERINQELLSAINKNNSNFKAVSGQVAKKIKVFKKDFQAKLLELSAYEEKITKLAKETSWLGKKLNKLKKDTAASLDKNLSLLRQDLEKQIASGKRRAASSNSTAKKAAVKAPVVKPAKTKSPVKKVSASTQAPKKSVTRSQPVQIPDRPAPIVPGTGGFSEQDLSQ